MPGSRPQASDDKGIQPETPADDDTEGHNLLDPSSAQHLAKARAQEVERQMRDRKRQKEARGR